MNNFIIIKEMIINLNEVEFFEFDSKPNPNYIPSIPDAKLYYNGEPETIEGVNIQYKSGRAFFITNISSSEIISALNLEGQL